MTRIAGDIGAPLPIELVAVAGPAVVLLELQLLPVDQRIVEPSGVIVISAAEGEQDEGTEEKSRHGVGALRMGV
jgi:hypothetical protein